MRRPTWHRDWAGFSGGWFPESDENPWQLTVLGIYWYGYYLDVRAPLIGDLRVGYTTSNGLANPYRRRDKPKRHFTWEREEWKP